MKEEIAPMLLSLHYLLQFARASSVSEHVVLEMQEGLPVRFTFPIKSGFLCFYLAPKIEDDE